MSIARVVSLAMLVVVGFLGLKLLPPWADDLRLRWAMRDAVREAPFATDAALIGAVHAAARALEVPLVPSDIQVERRPGGGVRLWAAYEVTVTLPLGFSHTQHFRPQVRSDR